MSFLMVSISIGYILLTLSLFINALCLLRSKDNIGSILLMDFFSLVLIGFLVIWSIEQESDQIIDVAIALSLVSFFSTIALTKSLK